VGILAAAIDIISDWLGDLKEGFCKPTFYLNRGFCCWGISGTSPSEVLLSK
jgi:chloride channel 3/4/5